MKIYLFYFALSLVRCIFAENSNCYEIRKEDL